MKRIVPTFDADRVAEAVFRFVDGETISEGEARLIASQWHGGQNSPLYAFASSGTILPDLADEITSQLPWEKLEVQALHAYIEENS